MTSKHFKTLATAIGLFEESAEEDNDSNNSSVQGCSSQQDMFEDDTSRREERLPKVEKKINFNSVPTPPSVAVPEKIVFCIDNTHDKGIGYTLLETTPNTIGPDQCFVRNEGLRLFITNKLAIAKDTEFAVASIEQDKFKWLSYLSSDSQYIINTLSELKHVDTDEESNKFDVTHMFRNVLGTIDLPGQTKTKVLPPNFIVRVVLVYGNSYVKPTVNIKDKFYIKFITSPFCILDVIYLHEKQSDFNNVETIYKEFGKVVSPRSYVLESSRNIMKMFNNMAKLVAHPYQRVSQTLWNF